MPLDVWQINYLAVTEIDVDITIDGYTGDAVEDETLISNAITAHMATIRPFVAGADNVDSSTLFQNRLVGVVASAIGTGRNFSTLTMEIGGSSISLRRFENGDIPNLDTLTINV